MHFIVDAREAFRSQRTGKGQWTKGFLEELVQRGLSVELLTDVRSPSVFSDVKQTVFSPGLRWHFRVASYLKSLSDDIVYVSPTSFIVPFFIGKKVNTVSIIHDLIAFHREPHDRKATCIERLLLPKILKTSAVVCTVSESTKRDLIEKFSYANAENVHVVYAGPFQARTTLTVPDNKTILCAGTLCPRKNQLRLIQAYALLPPSLRKQYRLVLVGARGWQDEEIVRLSRTTEGVEWRSYVPDNEYIALLSTCTVFALPSLYEGFGMQILDALQRGIPILTSSRGSLEEVVGNAARTVDPQSLSSISEGLEELLTNGDLRNELRLKGPVQAERFSWKKTVDLFLQAVETLVY